MSSRGLVVVEATNPPCGVCGEYADPERYDRIGGGKWLGKEPVIHVPLDIAPQPIAIRAPPNAKSVFTNCTELDNLCLGGYCSPTMCVLMTNIREVCGCLDYHSDNRFNPKFGVCGAFKSVQPLEDAVIDIPLELAPAQIVSRIDWVWVLGSVSTSCTEIDDYGFVA